MNEKTCIPKIQTMINFERKVRKEKSLFFKEILVQRRADPIVLFESEADKIDLTMDGTLQQQQKQQN